MFLFFSKKGICTIIVKLLFNNTGVYSMNKKSTTILVFTLLPIIFGGAIFIINSVYLQGFKEKVPPNIMVSVSDWIGFLGSFGGSLFGSIITIYSVYLTLENNHNETKSILANNENLSKKQIDENKEINTDNYRKNVLPVIAINQIQTKYQGNLFSNLISAKEKIPNFIEATMTTPNSDFKFVEYEIKSTFFIIKTDRIEIKSELSDEQWTNIENNWQRGIFVAGSSQPDMINIAYIPCVISNCGNGAALNITCNLKKCENEEETLWSTPINLSKGSDFKLGFYFELSEPVYGDYSFSINYFNIYSEKYQQQHNITINDVVTIISTEITQVFLGKS
jgi:hypothetical protein